MNNNLSSISGKPDDIKIKNHYIANLPEKHREMEGDFRDRQQKNYSAFRTVYDITMCVLFFGMSLCMFFADKLKITDIISFDPVFRKIFGTICALYGAFRLYRGIKKDY